MFVYFDYLLPSRLKTRNLEDLSFKITSSKPFLLECLIFFSQFNSGVAEPWAAEGRGGRHPFPSPDYLFAGQFYFSPTPIFSPFPPNAEPGPRLASQGLLKLGLKGKKRLATPLIPTVNRK